ncbi:MFS transporter [Vineibacter terrae]|uniref:MFS transporter n=1 Tax=Vineibacter terrae TaxID=2586908 RepID=UPI002E35422D|nr:MFS transporter [Vineibacter terrae]HEX2891153.1 MFS transporter [Vineibacter terrae]
MAIATAGAAGMAAGQSRTRVILASAIGSALEWYDFFIYGMAAALVFGELFFPRSDPTVGTLLAFATFGVGFFARPLGGLVFGHFGDKIGRKPMLVITLLLVGFGTMLIGFLPTYEQIGIWAPILLIVLRLIQGFGAGAEYGGAVILLVESAPHGKRGFWGSWAPIGVSVGNLLAAGVFYLVSELPREQLLSWGWRIPFLVSIVLIVVGLYIRSNIMETPVFTEAVAKRKPEKAPVWQAISRQPRNFFVLVGARIAENGLGYLIPVFGLNYVVNTLGVPRATALTALMVAFGVELVALLAFSMLSDRIGRRPVYIFGALFSAALAFPFFWLVGTKEAFLIAIAFILARAVGTAAMFGPQAAYFAELFGPKRRFSGFAFARELGSIIAGGPAPFLAAYFVLLAGGQTWAVSLYMIVLSLITAVAVWMGPETYRDDISQDASAR